MFEIIKSGNKTIIKNNEFITEILIKYHIVINAVNDLLNRINPHPLFNKTIKNEDIIISQVHECIDDLSATLVLKYKNKKVLFEYDVHMLIQPSKREGKREDNKGIRNVKISSSIIVCTKYDIAQIIWIYFYKYLSHPSLGLILIVNNGCLYW